MTRSKGVKALKAKQARQRKALLRDGAFLGSRYESKKHPGESVGIIPGLFITARTGKQKKYQRAEARYEREREDAKKTIRTIRKRGGKNPRWTRKLFPWT